MTPEEVLLVLSTTDDEVTFSVLSRALITNIHKRRIRSSETRAELHAVLRDMEKAGTVLLRPTTQGRGGSGLRIAKRSRQPPQAATPPKDPSTHEGIAP